MDAYDGKPARRNARSTTRSRPGPPRSQIRRLNPADAFLAQALYPPSLRSHILGRDGVGAVLPPVKASPMSNQATSSASRCDAGVEIWGTLAEK